MTGAPKDKEEKGGVAFYFSASLNTFYLFHAISQSPGWPDSPSLPGNLVIRNVFANQEVIDYRICNVPNLAFTLSAWTSADMFPFSGGTQSSPDSQSFLSILEDLCILAFCGRSSCRTSLCAFFNPLIIQIFCSFSICLFSISLVTFSVIQSSVGDLKGKSQRTYCHYSLTTHTHMHTLQFVSKGKEWRALYHIFSFLTS